jgi:hypothetical protein
MVPKVDDAGNDAGSRPTTPGQDVNCRIISPKAAAAAAAVAVGEKSAEVDDEVMIDTPSRRSIKSQSINHTTKETTRNQTSSYTSPSRVEIMARVESLLQQRPELDGSFKKN